MIAPLRPIVLVDVDGVLNPDLRCDTNYCKCHPGWTQTKAFPAWGQQKVNLTPAHGAMLRQLADDHDAELMWATSWGDEANNWIAPRAGLPRLPVAPTVIHHHDNPVPNGEWKVQHVAPWLAVLGRPFAWLDDEHDQISRALAAADVPLPAHRIVRVNPLIGLKKKHIGRAAKWLASQQQAW